MLMVGRDFARTLQQIDLALLVREIRGEAGLTLTELAKRAGTTQSVIARLEAPEYTGHSLATLVSQEPSPNLKREL
jgi:ribosome-binding protein aMBF1 (putative translation factor)